MELLANIDVDDVTVATDFYCRALNLTIGRRFGASGIELLGASSAIYLLEKPPGTAACNAPHSARHYSRHWTPVHLDFTVTDLDAVVERARAAGATLDRDIQERDWGRMANMADPFGHGFCLLEFRGRGYDEVVGS